MILIQLTIYHATFKISFDLVDYNMRLSPYFESCMIYLTKLNDILKVAWYFVSWINIILACHIKRSSEFLHIQQWFICIFLNGIPDNSN